MGLPEPVLTLQLCHLLQQCSQYGAVGNYIATAEVFSIVTKAIARSPILNKIGL